MVNPVRSIEAVSSQRALARFVLELRQSFDQTPERWQSVTVPDYLEALEAFVEGTEGWAVNAHVDLEAMDGWQLCARILYAASVYE